MSYLHNIFLNNYSYVIFTSYFLLSNLAISELLGKNDIFKIKMSTFTKVGFLISFLMLAFVEELIFRKYLAELFINYLSEDNTHIITSTLFALIHLTNIFVFEKEFGIKIYLSLFLQLTRTFILGMYLSILHKNLFYSTITHFIFNISQFIISYNYTPSEKLEKINNKRKYLRNMFYLPVRRHSFSGNNINDNIQKDIKIVYLDKHESIAKMHEFDFVYKKYI